LNYAAQRIRMEPEGHGAPDEPGEQAHALTAVLLDEHIRCRGTAEAPLFCAADVARHLGDANYRRHLKDIGGEDYARRVRVMDARGRVQEAIFFTEMGLYKYLLRSGRPKAEPFQAYVYKLLVAERKKHVDKALLELKLAQDAAKLAQDAARLAEEGRRVLERELLVARHETCRAQVALDLAKKRYAKARDEWPRFRPSEETVFQDYVQWCDERFQKEHPSFAPPSFIAADEMIMSWHYSHGTFDQGYEALVVAYEEDYENQKAWLAAEAERPRVAGQDK
jgi:prophage antirepressor-like protein